MFLLGLSDRIDRLEKFDHRLQENTNLQNQLIKSWHFNVYFFTTTALSINNISPLIKNFIVRINDDDNYSIVQNYCDWWIFYENLLFYIIFNEWCNTILLHGCCPSAINGCIWIMRHYNFFNYLVGATYEKYFFLHNPISLSRMAGEEKFSAQRDDNNYSIRYL